MAVKLIERTKEWYEANVRNIYGMTRYEYQQACGKLRAAFWATQGHANLRYGRWVLRHMRVRHWQTAALTGFLQDVGSGSAAAAGRKCDGGTDDGIW